MKRRLLITVLAVCLVGAGGFALKLWADGCCTGDALCNGGVVNIADTCNFYFTVDHDRVEGDQHSVKLWIQKDGDPTVTGYMMAIVGDPPYPVCVKYDKTLTLDANSTYYYYFACEDCSGRDPNGSSRYTLHTGDCD